MNGIVIWIQDKLQKSNGQKLFFFTKNWNPIKMNKQYFVIAKIFYARYISKTNRSCSRLWFIVKYEKD